MNRQFKALLETNWWPIALATTVALALRLWLVLQPGHLFGLVEYDDGVYFGASVALTHGLLPYKDFVFLQPPGFALLLSPFAALSHWVGTGGALAASRLLSPLEDALTTALIGKITLRQGKLFSGTASLAYALFPASVISARTDLLEPTLNLVCVIAFAFAFSEGKLSNANRRVLLAGAAIGVAGSIKVWAILPAVVLLAAYLVSTHKKRAATFSIGVFLGFLVPCAVFIAASPGNFISQVVLAQLKRSPTAMPDRLTRLAGLTGLPPAPSQSDHISLIEAAVVIVVLTALFGWVIMIFGREALAWAKHRERSTLLPLEWVAFTMVLVVGVAELVPPAFFYHYPAFMAPWAALLLGSIAHRSSRAFSASAYRPDHVSRAAVQKSAGVIALCLVALGLFNAARIVASAPAASSFADNISSLIPPGSCVISDDPGRLLFADRFKVSRSCPMVDDPFAVSLKASDYLGSSSSAGSARAVPAWEHLFAKADAIVISPHTDRGRIPWTPALSSWVDHHFTKVLSGPVTVYVKRG